MKFTCYLCVAILIFLGICGGVYAFTQFNLLLFLCLKSDILYRSNLAIGGVAALYTVYSLIAFKPFKGLK